MNLEANRRYHVTDTDGATYQLPHSSGSLNTGDVIEVFYNAILGDSEVHKFAAGGGELFAPRLMYTNQVMQLLVMFLH